MNWADFREQILAIKAPDDAEVFIDDGEACNEPGQVNSWKYNPVPGLIRKIEVCYSSAGADIATDFDLSGLNLEAIREMNEKLGTTIRVGVIFRRA